MSDIKINSGNYSNISNSIIGDNNQIIGASSVSDEDWTKMKKGIREVMRDLPEESKELVLLEEIYEYIREKDERGIKAFIKRNKEAFVTGICANVLYNTDVFEIIKNLIYK